jgi:ribose 5-phosphate isomerase A
MAPDPALELKRAAARAAVAHVRSGMVVGLGTGSTAALAVEEIGRRQREEGLAIVGIPTSERTARQAEGLGISLVELATHPRIDLTIDGADAVNRGRLDLIKGLGGALLREKIVAAASEAMVVIVDQSKLAVPFGASCPVPVAVVRFGWQATARRLGELGTEPVLRLDGADAPYVTDGGNLILDCRFGGIADPGALGTAIKQITGVVESGLFIDLATEVIVASPGGIEILRRD